MTLEEAFDELTGKAAENGLYDELSRLAAALGYTEVYRHPELVPPDVKAVIGSLFDYGKKVELSGEASMAFRTGIGRVYMGKPADGIADRVLDADISDNLDLL